MQHIGIGTARSMRDRFVAHIAAIHVDVLLVSACAGGLRQAGKAGQPRWCAERRVARQLRAGCKRQRLREPVAAEHVGHAARVGIATDRFRPPLAGIGGIAEIGWIGGIAGHNCRPHTGTPLPDEFAVVPDRKADPRAHQRVPSYRLQTVRKLRRVGLQELSARRCAEKQLAHLDRGADVARDRLHLAAAGVQPMRAGRARGARRNRELGNRSNRGQCLSAKPHGGDRFEIGQRGDLAGRVALQRERQLFARDAAPVVGHRQRPHAAGAEPHRDLLRACVQRIVQQLAQHRRGPLDHFTRSDLPDQLFGQRPDRRGGLVVRRRVHWSAILGSGLCPHPESSPAASPARKVHCVPIPESGRRSRSATAPRLAVVFAERHNLNRPLRRCPAIAGGCGASRCGRRRHHGPRFCVAPLLGRLPLSCS